MGTEGAATGTVTADGNSLTVMVLLISLAAAFFIQTFDPADRRVRIVFRTIAGTLLVGAASWPLLSQFIPSFAVSVANVASNAWAWFTLLMGTLLINSLIPAMKQRSVSQAPLFLPLKSNQTIYPTSKNGVLWEFVEGIGMSGPFCPTHRVRLFYWSSISQSEPTATFKEEDYLSGNGSFVCRIDKEEFTFIRPATMKIHDLRASAKEQFQVESDRRKLLGE